MSSHSFAQKVSAARSPRSGLVRIAQRGLAAAERLSSFSMHQSMDQCGFAAAQCGKALPYR